MRMQRRGRASLALLAVTIAALANLSWPQDAPAALTLTPMGSYDKPVYVTSEPGDAGRLYVVERDGTIRLRQGGVTLATAFLDLVDPEVRSTGSEQGLLSMAFAPDYPTTPYFFVAFTTAENTAATDPGDLVISRFNVSANPNLANAASRRDLLVVPHPTYANHNGGQLQFGPDGFLYVSTGDGGAFGDIFENAQNLNSLSGKLLRIDPLSSPTTAPYYVTPSSNPYFGAIAGRDEIWSYGLRNPWRFSFDRLTGALVIGDVGQNLWEEVDYEPVTAGAGRGDNFGWDCREGLHSYESAGCAGQTFTDPVFEYGHTDGNCSVTGGYVVRDPALPSLNGRYLFGDFCTGQLASMSLALPQATGNCLETPVVQGLTTFGEDANGGIYLAHQGGVKKVTGGTSCAGSPRALTVSAQGPGTVSGEGIDCPGDCTETFPNGTPVTLAAAGSGGATFSGWTDCPAPSGNTCNIVMNSDVSVSASFTTPPPASHTLTVTVFGDGAVTSAPVGIDCAGDGTPGDCDHAYTEGTPVSLSASPAAGSRFEGWSGACSGTGQCLVTMSADRSASARFRLITEVDLAATNRRVRKGKRARLTATVSPCPGRAGDLVELLRFGEPRSSHTLDDDCGTVFRPKIKRRSVFSAQIGADPQHTADVSEPVTIRLKH